MNHVHVSYYYQGIALGRCRRFKEALRSLEKSLKLYPKESNVWFYKGLALSDLNRDQEAMVALNRCIKLDPKNSKGFMNSARFEQVVYSVFAPGRFWDRKFL